MNIQPQDQTTKCALNGSDIKDYHKHEYRVNDRPPWYEASDYDWFESGVSEESQPRRSALSPLSQQINAAIANRTLSLSSQRNPLRGHSDLLNKELNRSVDDPASSLGKNRSDSSSFLRNGFGGGRSIDGDPSKDSSAARRQNEGANNRRETFRDLLRAKMTAPPNIQSQPSKPIRSPPRMGQTDLTRLNHPNTSFRENIHGHHKHRYILPEIRTIDGILWQIGLKDAMPAFNKHGITNLWLPIPKQTLRHFFENNQDLRSFSELQDQSLDCDLDHLDIQDMGLNAGTFHAALEDGDDLIHGQRVLGEGAFGIVEEVSLPTSSSPIVCVRKKIGRPRQLRAQKQIMTAFAREINVMRQVDHHHCVRLLGSYTDFESVNILIQPIADTDLASFLDQPLGYEEKEILYKGIHCLCNALNYLHQKKIRHEDLKPQNILILGENILLTDFGFSLDFSDDSISTTTGRPSAWTVRYSAPEVLDFEPRNRASDIFSLGCVLYEMISAIDGHSLSEVKDHWKRSGNGQSSFARNPDAASHFLDRVPSSFDPEGLPFLREYTQFMLHNNRDLRPSAQQVVDRLADLSLFFADSPPHALGCCEVPQHPSRKRIDVLDLAWPEYWLYPLRNNDWAYILLDLDFKRVASFPPNYLEPLESHVQIRQLGQELYERAQRDKTRRLPELENTQPIWKEHQCDFSRAKLHVETSAKILSIKNVWSDALNAFVRLPHEAGSSKLLPRFHQRLVHISLVPICLPRSPFYGTFFYMLSFPFLSWLNMGNRGYTPL